MSIFNKMLVNRNEKCQNAKNVNHCYQIQRNILYNTVIQALRTSFRILARFVIITNKLK